MPHQGWFLVEQARRDLKILPTGIISLFRFCEKGRVLFFGLFCTRKLLVEVFGPLKILSCNNHDLFL